MSLSVKKAPAQLHKGAVMDGNAALFTATAKLPHSNEASTLQNFIPVLEGRAITPGAKAKSQQRQAWGDHVSLPDCPVQWYKGGEGHGVLGKRTRQSIQPGPPSEP